MGNSSVTRPGVTVDVIVTDVVPVVVATRVVSTDVRATEFVADEAHPDIVVSAIADRTALGCIVKEMLGTRAPVVMSLDSPNPFVATDVQATEAMTTRGDRSAAWPWLSLAERTSCISPPAKRRRPSLFGPLRPAVRISSPSR